MKLSQRGAEVFGITDAVDISPYITTETTQNQFDALTSLATDIGTDAFRKSTLLKSTICAASRVSSRTLLCGVRRLTTRQNAKAEKRVYWYGY